ncbi:hypothetical protein BKA69DRAFT_1125616 [Paraphysoderma sedebokerense]|nr:hypothetical protein BKA69DRAFT_1125616 [Paraphysoderma sedebokerense]
MAPDHCPPDPIAFCALPFIYSNRLSPCVNSFITAFTLSSFIIVILVKILLSRRKKNNLLGRGYTHIDLILGTSDDEDIDRENDEEYEDELSPIPPPPRRLTRFAEFLILVVIFCSLYRVIYFGITTLNTPLVFLFISEIIILSAWVIHYILWIPRRAHWDSTWTLAGFWITAFLAGVISIYDYALYWINPIPERECNLKHITGNGIVMPTAIIRLISVFVLLCVVIGRFYTISRIITSNQYEYHLIDENEQENEKDGEHPNAETDADVEPGTRSPPKSFPIPSLVTADADTKYKPPHSFRDYSDKFKKLMPFIWPTTDRFLQFLIIVCFVLLVTGRVVNVLVPYEYKKLVDVLSVVLDGGKPAYAWDEILLFVFLRFLQGGVGLLNTLQNTLWIPVGQFTTREISIKMFQHLHGLSHRFHLNRKTGEILRVQDRGVSSIVSLLSSILFNIVPTLVDIFIAVIYFAVQFDIYFGIIVFITMTLYIISTVYITEIRTKYRRQTNLLDNAMQAKAVDSLLNFETVKFYNAEDFEAKQYAKAMHEYQKADWKSSLTSSMLNLTQNIIIQLGLLAGCLLCAKRVVDGIMTVGDFVLYLTYINQLYGPLNWFGSYYRVIQKNFVDMEKMLDLFKEPPEIKDAPRAAPLIVKEGTVTFENVSFSYDNRVQTLRDVSFHIPKGQTVALVGPSGGGKSTILRLLFRFYDVQGGRILIDGQDIRTVRQKDLRNAIGVVPQDTVLFNDTIRYNIRYGKVTASDHQVEDAASAAQIHSKITGFPDAYDTKVGERGMRLSGGEKQRVAIARTLLKNPPIVLLDEATSALDTTTERLLQSEFQRMTKNRTTLIIAHRLSTIVHADQILVVQNGYIVEKGSHDELMKMENGVYQNMWMQQLKDDAMVRKIGKKGKKKQKNAGLEKIIDDSVLESSTELQEASATSSRPPMYTNRLSNSAPSSPFKQNGVAKSSNNQNGLQYSSAPTTPFEPHFPKTHDTYFNPYSGHTHSQQSNNGIIPPLLPPFLNAAVSPPPNSDLLSVSTSGNRARGKSPSPKYKLGSPKQDFEKEDVDSDNEPDTNIEITTGQDSGDDYDDDVDDGGNVGLGIDPRRRIVSQSSPDISVSRVLSESSSGVGGGAYLSAIDGMGVNEDSDTGSDASTEHSRSRTGGRLINGRHSPVRRRRRSKLKNVKSDDILVRATKTG